jgi:hypothetical protein
LFAEARREQPLHHRNSTATRAQAAPPSFAMGSLSKRQEHEDALSPARNSDLMSDWINTSTPHGVVTEFRHTFNSDRRISPQNDQSLLTVLPTLSLQQSAHEDGWTI